MSTFGSINTAYSSLVAQRRALDVTGQNIANANTPGYSRQRVDMNSVAGPSVPALFSTYDGTGGGVAVTDVSRIRDDFYAVRQQIEHGNLASSDRAQQTLSDIEDAVPEPSDTGIAKTMQDFFKSFTNLSQNPGGSMRQAVVESGQGVADKLHDAAGNLDQQWSNLRQTLTTSVADVNATTTEIANLNKAIQFNTAGGVPSNELADKRDALVLKLSDAIGVTARPGKDGSVDVMLGGSALVSGSNALTLGIQGASVPSDATTTPVKIVYTNDGSTVPLSGGDVHGIVTALTDTIPRYKAQLDGFAADLANQVNTLHRQGYDLTNGPDVPGGDGRDYFGTNDGTTSVTAANIKVVVTADQIAASANPGGNLDGGMATRIAALSTSTSSPVNSYKTMISGLGVESAAAQQRFATRKDVAAKADDAMTTTSGVDTDEEMTNVLAFQRGYEAAAKVMTTIDSTINTLIQMVS
ncbi:flagellar hook-associated protein 1 FlgK [Motilibacter rhizosphaerae]|uniref:Flagellar hook-associated protein 1 n=1 Tax=Motilibacter rhizosphaerae TaxID=598652 RepID=A0A4Q7NW17_9ACTN|nr:flagellar hook-associated protein FlgK [Motilibacter rhizosphaerae]RZS91397.1 flagellar hook-associated protein 1 FlgK [Motilibacter rhizosphaerae]